MANQPRIASAPSDHRPATRLGITVSRRVGGAVVRTRVKRCVREWFRRATALPPGKDLVVIARAPAAQASTLEAGRELDGAIRELVRQEERR
jgi:ribonuclease P protein component